ncbi:MAG: hypothetical protein ABJN42_12215, partial [Roseibium sp.]
VQAKVSDLPPGEQAVFLALLKNPDLSPPATTTVANLSATLDRFERAAADIVAALAETMASGDSSKVLARLMIELSGLQRKEALDSRLAARQQAKSELQTQAGDMRAAAEKATEAAMIQMVVSVAAAAVSIVASAVSIGSSMKSISSLKDVKQLSDTTVPEPRGSDIKIGNHRAPAAPSNSGWKSGQVGADPQGVSLETNVQMDLKSIGQKEAMAGGVTGIANAISSGAQGSSAAISSGATQEAEFLKADASLAAADAEETKSEGDLHREFQQTLDEMIKAMTNFLKEMRSAEVEQMAAVTRG